jgi:sphinganine-1-phosphate aldolase
MAAPLMGRGTLFQYLSPTYIDSKLEKKSPTVIILITAISIASLSIFVNSCKKAWGQTRREQMGQLALRMSTVKKKYAEDVNKQLVHFQESVKGKWENFAPLHTTIPEQGLDIISLLNMVEGYSQTISRSLKDKHLSGTIYSKNLDAESQYSEVHNYGRQDESFRDDVEYFDFLAEKLEKLFAFAFKKSYLWNSLHSDEFAVGACIDYQVVRIVASMFGGAPNEVMGFVTSGGTESLMVAMRSYREWGIKNRGHAPGEGVIIASQSVHASIMKAGSAYLVNVNFVQTDEAGRIDMKQLEETVKKYGNQVIAIIGSAPSYPTGVIDPIEAMAKIASENGCGMHVDCCLGAFIINHLPQHETSFLQMPGVTSLSADTHKNGMAPKGSSVLVTKKLGAENLAYHSIYSIPGWSGGVYGTPKDAGSQSCVPSLTALLALLGTGQEGYKRIAGAIHRTTCEVADVIRPFHGKLRLLVEPQVNVVAFKVDEAWGLQKGATYAFAHEMAKRKFVFNTLSNDTAHFCVTARFASNPKALEELKTAIKDSLDAVEKLNHELIAQGKKFSGDAGMYCALDAAIAPNSKTLSTQKYIENLLLGQQGAKDAVKSYFLAQLNPYATS